MWPGSHRLAAEPFEPKTPITTAPLLRGDCMLHDFRLRHAGLPNLSDRSRPVLYLSYARRWFFDEVNHRGRRPVDLSMSDYDALPESCRGLLVRALSQALRER